MRLSAFWAFKKRLVVTAGILLTQTVSVLNAEETLSNASVEYLRCEHRVNPLGIDVPQPQLGWKIKSDQRGWFQSAYQILVATKLENLTTEKADLWESGKVTSDKTWPIPYDGKPLKSNQACYWKVRVWDRQGNLSAWSKPSGWTMGIVFPENWHAKWISLKSDPSSTSFENAQWIWHHESEWKSSTEKEQFLAIPPHAECFIQRVINLPKNCTIQKAQLIATADNSCDLWINGKLLAKTNNYLSAINLDISGALHEGSNLVAVRVVNGGEQANPAGFIAKLIVMLEGGETIRCVTDSSWKSTNHIKNESWKTTRLNHVSPAKIVASWGKGPWKKNVKIPKRVDIPIFRKTFNVNKKVQRALVHISGLGHYELFLNGKKVGNRYLDPAWSVYEKTVYYTTYDITDMLNHSDNAFGVMLGKGFYNTVGNRRTHCVYTDRQLMLFLQAEIDYIDGTHQQIVTDESWLTKVGPITHSAIVGGSDYDARRLSPEWCNPKLDDSKWMPSVITNGPTGILTASVAPPMQEMDRFDPVSIDEPEAGIFVYNFDQNASAVPSLRIQGKRGQKIRLTPSEQRHKQSDRSNNGTGRVNQAGVGKPYYWEYTLRGGEEEIWMPQFVYSSFQYLELTGGVPIDYPNPDGLPIVKQLQSVHIRNNSKQVGTFECSEPLFEKIEQLIDWAVRSNMAHVLTDCPHREKLGWLEVSYLMGPSIAGRYDIARFYSKKTHDIRDSQNSNGMIQTVAPNYAYFGKSMKAGMFNYTLEWGAAGVFLPWQIYQRYGDTRILVENYPSMKRFVDFIENTSTDLIAKPGLGDWYDYGHGKGKVGVAQFTPADLTATATFYACTRLVENTAKLLNKKNDSQKYATLASRIKQKFNDTYFDGVDTYKNHGSPQTANAMALECGLVDPSFQSAVVDRIVKDLSSRDYQQTSGDVGFHYLIEALSRHGRNDVLYKIVNRHDEGSYGFIIDRGWTSMPEAWDADTAVSMNHCMLGHVQQWFYQNLVGIQRDPMSIGYRKIIIQPAYLDELNWVRGSYDSISGKIAVDWKREADRIQLKVTIPGNTTATVYLPASDPNDISESGKPLTEAMGVKLKRIEKGNAVLSVGSGTYFFESRTAARVLKTD